METHDPLTLTSAEAFWDSVAHKLHARTIYQIVHMPWLSEEARTGIIQDGAVIDNIIDRLKEQFFEAVRRKKVWSDAVERWFARTHRRTTRKVALKEARKYFPAIGGQRDGQADRFELPGHWDSPESSAEKREILERIVQHWLKLPPAKARLFQDLVNGLAAEEISARDGIRSGTIRKRIHDLRRELRELIADKEKKPCPRKRRTRMASDEQTRHPKTRRKAA
jgi:DNA-directed RNA polymerase specialized sigma24 family protein